MLHSTRVPVNENLSRFSFTSTPASSTSLQSSVFSTAPTPSTAPSTAGLRLTPLQRLGARANHASESPRRPPQPRTKIGKENAKGLPANPSFVPLPKVDVAEVEALNRQCGSEDHMVPDSDGEAEEEAELPARKLDLSRFAFS